jgi:hypothetical protein
MKTGRMLMIALGVLAATPAFAAAEFCRSIRSESERLACFDKHASPVDAGKRQARTTKEKAGSEFVDPVDLLKAENDKVDARLKGICRGC